MDYSVHEVFRRCGRPQCWCAAGDQRHGPYVVLASRYADGRRGQRTLKTPTEVENARTFVDSVRHQRRQRQEQRCKQKDLRRALFCTSRSATSTMAAALAWIGCYRHAGRIRERRDFPAALRQRRRYELLDEEWRNLLSLSEYQTLCRTTSAARRRAARLRLPFDEAEAWQQELDKIIANRTGGGVPRGDAPMEAVQMTDKDKGCRRSSSS